MTKYKLKEEYLSEIFKNQLDEFRLSLSKGEGNKDIIFQIQNKGYTVNNTKEIKESKIQSIGFFSGAGGLDIGAQLAGSKVISSLDFDSDSVKTMKENEYFNHSKHFLKDIKDVRGSDYSSILKENNPEKLILIGGPPCQPFSKAGYWVTHKNRLGNEDPRNMIGNYLRVIDEIRPDGFILENVESLLHPKNIETVQNLEYTISQIGYNLMIYHANSLDFGVPQKRKRVFFIASRKEIKGEPTKTHGDLKDRSLNASLKPYENVVDWIAKFDDERYFEPEEITTGKTYDYQLKQIPPGKNYFSLTSRDYHPNPQFDANTRFWSFLLKLNPELPSWTVAAQPGPWVGPFHWNNRRLRVPEIAAIQTFPEDYKFIGSRRSIQKQIGNAVPSLMGKAIVEHLIKNI